MEYSVFWIQFPLNGLYNILLNVYIFDIYYIK